MGRRAEALLLGTLISAGAAGGWWVWRGQAPAPPAEVEAPAAPAKKKRAARKSGGTTSEPEGRCLPPPDASPEAGEEPAFQASVGLGPDQIRGPMRAALPGLSACITGDWPESDLLLEITVACTGRVSRVAVLDDGGLDAALVACVTAKLGEVRFPAHDLPDGETFQYPVQFSR